MKLSNELIQKMFNCLKQDDLGTKDAEGQAYLMYDKIEIHLSKGEIHIYNGDTHLATIQAESYTNTDVIYINGIVGFVEFNIH